VTPAGCVNRLVQRTISETDVAVSLDLFCELVASMQVEVAGLYGIKVASFDELDLYLSMRDQIPPELEYLRESDAIWLRVARKGRFALEDLSLASELPAITKLVTSAEEFIQLYRQQAVEC